jgi:hypothetical protein
VAAAVVEQVAEHHRDIAVDSGVSDRDTEFNSAHDRVGNNSGGQGRRLGHRAPRQVGDTALTPASSARRAPSQLTDTTRSTGIPTPFPALHFRKSRFRTQQASTRQRALSCGDYGLVVDGRLVASVERKSLADLVASLTSGTLRYQLADLAALPRAAVVVEDRYSQLFKLDRVRPAVVAEGLAELQIRWPNVPIVFYETRQLAEEWTYRFLAAAHLWAIPNTLRYNASRQPRSTSPNSIRQPQRRNRAPPRPAPGPAPSACRFPTAGGYAPTSGRHGTTPTTPTDPGTGASAHYARHRIGQHTPATQNEVCIKPGILHRRFLTSHV